MYKTWPDTLSLKGFCSIIVGRYPAWVYTTLFRSRLRPKMMSSDVDEIYNDIDASQDQSEDNIDRDSGFFATQAGDLPTIIEQDPFRDRVSGHVLYNQSAIYPCWKSSKYCITI